MSQSISINLISYAALGTKPLTNETLFFTVVGFDIRAYTLSHSASPFLWRFFSR
jgi:hypothetical protein